MLVCLFLRQPDFNSEGYTRPEYLPNIKYDKRFEEEQNLEFANQNIRYISFTKDLMEHSAYYSSSIQLENSIIENCEAFGASLESGNGGGICAVKCQIQLINSSFYSNKAIFGGSLCAKNSNILIQSSKLNRSAAMKLGGAIYIIDQNNFGLSYIFSTIIEGNVAKSCGGAIYLEDISDINLDNVTISSNSAQISGAGIFGLRVRKVILYHCYFTENYLTSPDCIHNSTYFSNLSRKFRFYPYFSRGGGAIFLKADDYDSLTSLDVYDCYFDKNRCSNISTSASNAMMLINVRATFINGYIQTPFYENYFIEGSHFEQNVKQNYNPNEVILPPASANWSNLLTPNSSTTLVPAPTTFTYQATPITRQKYPIPRTISSTPVIMTPDKTKTPEQTKSPEKTKTPERTKTPKATRSPRKTPNTKAKEELKAQWEECKSKIRKILREFVSNLKKSRAENARQLKAFWTKTKEFAKKTYAVIKTTPFLVASGTSLVCLIVIIVVTVKYCKYIRQQDEESSIDMVIERPKIRKRRRNQSNAEHSDSKREIHIGRHNHHSDQQNDNNDDNDNNKPDAGADENRMIPPGTQENPLWTTTSPESQLDPFENDFNTDLKSGFFYFRYFTDTVTKSRAPESAAKSRTANTEDTF